MRCTDQAYRMPSPPRTVVDDLAGASSDGHHRLCRTARVVLSSPAQLGFGLIRRPIISSLRSEVLVLSEPFTLVCSALSVPTLCPAVFQTSVSAIESPPPFPSYLTWVEGGATIATPTLMLFGLFQCHVPKEIEPEQTQNVVVAVDIPEKCRYDANVPSTCHSPGDICSARTSRIGL